LRGLSNRNPPGEPGDRMRLYVSLLGFVAVLLIVGTASSVPVRPDLIEKLVAEGRVEE